MASDFSSECTDAIAALDDEKEEGEISLDDVSSSEEGHVNYGSNQKCRGCTKPQECVSGCAFSSRFIRSKHPRKKEVRIVPQDAEQGKENHHLIKDNRLPSSTLQEKNDDLIPISSDSDMELVGLTKRKHRTKSSKVKKKKKKRRPHLSVPEKEDALVSNEISENVTITRGSASSKENRLLKAHYREKSPIYETRTSPRRHRSPVQIRPVEKKIKSPIAHRSTEIRKHSKKLKPPVSTNLVNPLHKKVRKRSSPSTFLPSPDLHVVKLLKKVRQLEMVGTAASQVSNKAKEHGSSLKEKLNNILKPSIVNNEEATSLEKTDDDKKKNENGEEEEDLNILRQKALETKQNKTTVAQEPLNVEADIKGNCVNDDEDDDDDDDDEDLKLRLIALQSAVYKKYRNRVQTAKAQKDKKAQPPRSESPFSESFINNISLAEDASEVPSDSPQVSETPLAEDFNNSIEDMELDSDIETDANSAEVPYPSTDLVNNELVLEAEQLGIDTTDVSLININSKSFVQFGSYLSNNEKEKTPPVRPVYSSIDTASANSDPDFRLLPKDSQERIFASERPYSPSDAPVFDPDLTESLLPQNETFSETLNLESTLPNSSNFYSNNHQKEMEIEIIDDLPETDIDGSPLVPMEKESSTLYHIPEHLSYQMLHPSYQPLYLSHMHQDVNRIPIMNHQPLVPQSVLRVSQQLQQDSKKSPKSPEEWILKNSLVIPVNEFTQQQSSHFSPTISTNFPVVDQFRKPPVNPVDKNQIDSQQTKENVSVNHEEESVLDSSKGKKKSKRKRKNSKKSLIEVNKETETQIPNSADQTDLSKNNSEDHNDLAKRLKNSEDQADSTKVTTNYEDQSLAKRLKIVEKEKSKNKETKSRQVSESGDNTLDKSVNCSKSLKNTKNKKQTEDIELRRKSIDEDEEALRAILLASMGKRTRSPKCNNSSIDTKTSEVVISNVSENPSQSIQKSQINGVPESTELVSNKPTLNSTVDSGIEISKGEVSKVATSKDAPLKVTNVTGTKVPLNFTPLMVSSPRVVLSKITLSKVLSSKISPSKVLSSKVTPSKILSSKISPSKVQSLQVPPSKVQSLQVPPLKVPSSQVPKVQSSQVPPSKAASSQVSSSKVQPPKVPPSKVSPTKITPSKPSPSKLTPSKILSTRVLPKITSTKILINNNESVNSVLGKRKTNSVLVSGTPRKLVKRTVIPASTKVVNNAKRYQISLLQKRLNLQKAITTFNVKKIIANKSLRVLNNNQNTRSISPNVPAANPTERFIISLNSDSESDSESERRNRIVAVTNKSSVEKTLTIPTTEFERSVDQFLRDVRKKQESTAAFKQPTNSSLPKTIPPSETTTKGKKSTLPVTPLAVRHLPASQQEEYHRLKQQILEREKLKLQRSTTSQQTSNASVPPSPLSPTGSTTCSNPKVISPITSINVSKSPLVTKSTENDNSVSAIIPNSTLALQGKANLTIQIKNSPPTIISVKNTTSLDSNANIPEKPKQPAFPKLRILTCEQINRKLLQIQVSQKEEGRKVIVGDSISPARVINDSRNKNNTPREISTKERDFAENLNVNECDLDASIIILSDSRDKDKTRSSQSLINKESRINKNVETSTVALSKNSTGSSTNNSTTTVKNATISEIEKGVVKEAAGSKKNNFSKKNGRKEPNVCKESSKSKESTVSKELIATKQPTSVKESIIPKQPTSVKESIVTKQPVKELTVSEQTTVDKHQKDPESEIRKESISSDKPVQNNQITGDQSDVSKEKTDTQKVSKSSEKCQETWDVIKKGVQAEVEEAFKLGDDGMKRTLVETEQELVNKRYVVLDDLAEVSKSLRQWELEKDLQASLSDEVKKLREQLKEAEEKHQEQKDKVANMGVKVSAVHEKMNVGRKECFRLSKICTGLGSRIYGQKYKVPETGVQLVNNRLKEVAQHTSQLCRKKNEKRRKLSVTSESSSRKDSDVASSELVESTGQLEKQISDKSTSDKEAEGQASSEIVIDQIEADKDKDNSSPNETESLGTQSSNKSLTSCSSASEKASQSKEVENRINGEEDDPKDSCEVNNTDSSRTENTESDEMCHTSENSIQNQINGVDNQSKKTTIRPYVSILDHMKTARNSLLDGILCPYQLMGSCQDAECQFLHHTPSH